MSDQQALTLACKLGNGLANPETLLRSQHYLTGIGPAALVHPAKRKTLFKRLQAANPSPTTELEHKTPFELLVAVMLSAHTTDKSVNAATRKLFPVANTPQKILALGVEGVLPYLKSVGLYNAKAQNLIGLCRMLIEKHGGEIPATRETLEELPGVGRKTASIILNMVFGETTIAVDTHIFRVANRTGLAPGKTPRAVEEGLIANVPQAYKKDAHHWLILHGRYVCTARLPACPKCIIADLCAYPHKTPPKALKRSDAPVAHLPIGKRIVEAVERKAIQRKVSQGKTADSALKTMRPRKSAVRRAATQRRG